MNNRVFQIFYNMTMNFIQENPNLPYGNQQECAIMVANQLQNQYPNGPAQNVNLKMLIQNTIQMALQFIQSNNININPQPQPNPINKMNQPNIINNPYSNPQGFNGGPVNFPQPPPFTQPYNMNPPNNNGQQMNSMNTNNNNNNNGNNNPSNYNPFNPNSNTNPNPSPNTNPYPNSNPNMNPYANPYTNPNPNPNPYGNPYTNPNPSPHANPYTNPNPSPHANPYPNSNPNLNQKPSELIPSGNKTIQGTDIIKPEGGNIINIIFEASSGLKVVLKASMKTLLPELFQAYLDRLDLRKDYVGSKIVFLYDREKINPFDDEFADQTLEDMEFTNLTNITVLDINNVIGA